MYPPNFNDEFLIPSEVGRCMLKIVSEVAVVGSVVTEGYARARVCVLVCVYVFVRLSVCMCLSLACVCFHRHCINVA